jgi:hypothetical protein
MPLKTHLITLIAFVALAACSKPPPPKHFDQLKVTYKKYDGQIVQRQIPIVFALVDATTDYRIDPDQTQHPYCTHMLCLANYDVSAEPEKPNANILKDVPPEQDLAPLKVCLNINDEEGTNASSPLKPGTYFVGITKEQPNRISSAFINWDNRRLNYVYLNRSAMTGSLRLDSVSDDAIVGEMDLRDGDHLMAGTFNLKPKIKKWIVPPMN